jgi:protein involved in polysaccharide export with SLBB domain
MNGDEARNVLLQPKDLVRVYTTYREAERVMVDGEVARPGTYEIHKGEKLSDLLRRAGGFTPEAYAYGAVFKRKNVKESQERNLRTFLTQLQAHVLQTAAEETTGVLSAEDAASAKAELSLNQGAWRT